MSQERYLEPAIAADLSDKMVLLGGPRQVGKTTLAEQVAARSSHALYLSWDRRTDRRQLMAAQWPTEPSCIVLDELHKYRRWKQWLKGEYDRHRRHHQFLVTGSARLDIFRRGGDSLQGRYHHYRLHPFSVAELTGPPHRITPMTPLPDASPVPTTILPQLLRYSGFPEPILAQSDRVHRRWQKERLERFVREDVRELEQIRDLSAMQLLTDLLPTRVGSLLSLNAIREDLEVSHRALTHWMEILERLYFSFRILPFYRRHSTGLKKMPKLYLWDWSLVPDPGARFENLVAAHLLKLCHYLEDTEGYATQLWYLRDLDKHEVDFLVTVNRRPWFAVEARLQDTVPSKTLRYFGERLAIPHLYQVVCEGTRHFVQDGVHVEPAPRFFSRLC